MGLSSGKHGKSEPAAQICLVAHGQSRLGGVRVTKCHVPARPHRRSAPPWRGRADDQREQSDPSWVTAIKNRLPHGEHQDAVTRTTAVDVDAGRRAGIANCQGDGALTGALACVRSVNIREHTVGGSQEAVIDA